ncbi:flagellar filament capping protein FliD [Desulfallas sp. Bu1-1]|uniref:flagellar filament capping protein FliD n=1 Tax=Desulfallas sp. Bu1-1 TaxID=2787620 RepID=UPI00189DF57B|nr:flagellar filament capping protein FliD [Desulfallas sp. Bu1-1]MBF7081971.1 flagellar filament capping protein FliD [Desulfallas sp. Bu1-1]
MISNLRIGGLASGIDTDSIIKDLMRAHRIPLTKLEQSRQILEWQQEDYRAINTALRTFRDAVFNMKLQSTYMAKRVTSSDENAVTATANSNAGNSVYNVKVNALATSAYNSSQGTLSKDPGDKIDSTKTLWSQKDKFANTGFDWILKDVVGEQINVTAEGTVFKLAHDAITTVPSQISVYPDGDGTAAPDTYSVFTDQTAYNDSSDPNKVLLDMATGQMTFSNTITAGSVITADYSYNTKTFKFSLTTYNQEHQAHIAEFTIDANTQSLNDVINLINADDKLEVTVFYDAGADKVSISRNITGDNNTGGVEIGVGTTGFLAEVLQINEANEQGGTDASATINGITITRATNNISFNNVTFNLKSETSSFITVSVDNNTDAVFNSIKDFIDKYNSVIETISNKLYEERYRDYLPLTDEQREELTDDQINKWTEKARSGLLRRDPILSDIYSRFRMTMSAVVPGVSGGYVKDGKTVYSDRLSAIGITTTADYMSGKLVIDENKLREAIEKDPQGILDLFTKNPDTKEYSEMGIAMRLYEDVNYGMERLIDKAGNASDVKLVDNSFIGKEIKEIDERIDTWEDRLKQLEDRYYRQFTAMEKAIQQMNSQSMWLMQQFGMYSQQ